jgi:UDP-GlcNAc3NAcA epimerase
MTKLLSVVGARPQFVKLAPLHNAIEKQNDPKLEHIILHTGQHYDEGLSAVFFNELNIPRASINLGVGSGSHGQQTGKMIAGIEEVLQERQPDMVLIFGDTNSTVAAALAASKLHIPVAHIEAGLRSFNRKMPEEINRIVADHIADILLAPTATAVDHLTREGLAEKTVLTGDIMYDVLLRNLPLALERSNILERLQLQPQAYYLTTLHRAENTDDPKKLAAILGVLKKLAAEAYPVVFPMHPRTASRIQQYFPDWDPGPKLKVIDPVGYLDMLSLINEARITLTDSGGLQKEVFFLNCPAVTLRTETEWVETITAGGNVLTSSNSKKIKEALQHWEAALANGKLDFSEQVHAHFGNGDAAEKILQAVLQYLK